MPLESRITAILEELRRTLATPDEENADRLVEALTRARRVFVTGAGRSGMMMRSFAMRLMHLGFDVSVVGETVTPGISGADLLLVGSGSGATASLVNHANAAKKLGATIGLITILENSPIGSLADIILTIPAPTPKIGHDPGFHSIQPMGSLFEQSLLVTLDALALMLMDATGQSAEGMFARHANLE